MSNIEGLQREISAHENTINKLQQNISNVEAQGRDSSGIREILSNQQNRLQSSKESLFFLQNTQTETIRPTLPPVQTETTQENKKLISDTLLSPSQTTQQTQQSKQTKEFKAIPKTSNIRTTLFGITGTNEEVKTQQEIDREVSKIRFKEEESGLLYKDRQRNIEVTDEGKYQISVTPTGSTDNLILGTYDNLNVASGVLFESYEKGQLYVNEVKLKQEAAKQEAEFSFYNKVPTKKETIADFKDAGYEWAISLAEMSYNIKKNIGTGFPSDPFLTNRFEIYAGETSETGGLVLTTDTTKQDALFRAEAFNIAGIFGLGGKGTRQIKGAGDDAVSQASFGSGKGFTDQVIVPTMVNYVLFSGTQYALGKILTPAGKILLEKGYTYDALTNSYMSPQVAKLATNTIGLEVGKQVGSGAVSSGILKSGETALINIGKKEVSSIGIGALGKITQVGAGTINAIAQVTSIKNPLSIAKEQANKIVFNSNYQKGKGFVTDEGYGFIKDDVDKTRIINKEEFGFPIIRRKEEIIINKKEKFNIFRDDSVVSEISLLRIKNEKITIETTPKIRAVINKTVDGFGYEYISDVGGGSDFITFGGLGVLSLPELGGGGSNQRNRRTINTKTKLKKGYTPDIKSIIFNIVGKRPTRTITGFEARPLPIILEKKKKKIVGINIGGITFNTNRKAKKSNEVMTL